MFPLLLSSEVNIISILHSLPPHLHPTPAASERNSELFFNNYLKSFSRSRVSLTLVSGARSRCDGEGGGGQYI